MQASQTPPASEGAPSPSNSQSHTGLSLPTRPLSSTDPTSSAPTLLPPESSYPLPSSIPLQSASADMATSAISASTHISVLPDPENLPAEPLSTAPLSGPQLVVPLLGRSDRGSNSSSPSPSMYESPSPPSSDTAPEDVYPVSRRRRKADVNPTVIPLSTQSDRPISPIHHPTTAWSSSNYISDVADESTPLNASLPPTRLHPHNEDPSPSPDIYSGRTRFADDPVFFPSRQHFRGEFNRDSSKDRYILGCSILLVFTIVFVIIVSGVTTIIENSNFPQLQIFSDWPNGGQIPRKYGCHAPHGDPVSFPLRWNNVPRSATNLVILFANAEAMLHKGYDPVHWLVTDIPVNEGDEFSLAENASANHLLMPPGAKQLSNSFSQAGAYWPPCTSNSSGLFVIHVYAIEAPAVIDHFRDAREVMNRFVGVPVARLSGKYKGEGHVDEPPVEVNSHLSLEQNFAP